MPKPLRTLLVVVLLASPTVAGSPAPPRPIVGAIRWDGWYGRGDVVRQVESSLGQRKYHFRLPWFAHVLGDDSVRIDGDSRVVMEQEIAYAVRAGLDYWAFVDYGDESQDMRIALDRYLSTPGKKGLRYCFVEEGPRVDRAGTAAWPRLVEHFRDADYQTVLDGRPLLFVFVKTVQLGRAEWDDLRRQTVAAGLRDPYLVLMGWNPQQDAKDMAALGFDAVSAYARGGSYSMAQPGYVEQCGLVRRDLWERWQALGVPFVTFASAGWDTRPRNERPPSWMRDEVRAEPDPTPPARQRPLVDAVTATPAELADHVRQAVDWAQAHPGANPSGAVVIYAWNEHDEGGWLQPTRGPGGGPDESRIEALRRVLAPAGSDPEAAPR